ncbi:MAG: hypothetical protein N3D85_04935 [Candidatus Bathyarchaeota archaeon]|nr:hypothetical protein [Candidatus Bathyarchaeota archaeon]
MPSIIPGYVYTLFASIIIGTLIVTSCAFSAANIKREVEEQQLYNIAKYVAAKSVELATSHQTENFTATLHLGLPPLIGNQRYHIQVANDSTRAWVEAGFGAVVLSSQKRVDIPVEVAASGVYVSGSGASAFLKYSFGAAGASLLLYGR